MIGWQTVRSGLAVALVATVGACLSPQPRLTASPSSWAPLEATIFPPYYGQVPFRVNKPAHVALFEILPGRGVSLLYPTSGSGFTQVSENWVPLRYNAQRWLYASDDFRYPSLGQSSGFDYGYGMGFGPIGGSSITRQSAPRYLFLIASEEPIDISQFQYELSSVRRFLGPNEYSSYQPYDIMSRLAYAVVPYANDENWVTDVFVDWGYDWGYGYTPGTSAATATWVNMRCADGSVGMARYVPGWGYDMMTCAPWVNGQQTPSPGDSVNTPPIGSPDGRGRANGADENGRSRAGSDSTSTRPALNVPQSAETRSRVAQLREDAVRSQFNELLSQELRRNVELRHRIDNVMGGSQGSSSGSRANSNDASSRSSRATRSRASDDGGRQNAEPGGASAPRSRERSQERQPSTRSAPRTSSPPPRSRESTPPQQRQTREVSPPTTTTPPPAPARRSRPPA